jgi:hypothetical protein
MQPASNNDSRIFQIGSDYSTRLIFRADSAQNMSIGDKHIWWQGPDRIAVGSLLVVLWYFRLRRIYIDIKNTPKRSPKVRRIEVIVATALWTSILLGVTVLLIVNR